MRRITSRVDLAHISRLQRGLHAPRRQRIKPPIIEHAHPEPKRHLCLRVHLGEQLIDEGHHRAVAGEQPLVEPGQGELRGAEVLLDRLHGEIVGMAGAEEPAPCIEPHLGPRVPVPKEIPSELAHLGVIGIGKLDEPIEAQIPGIGAGVAGRPLRGLALRGIQELEHRLMQAQRAEGAGLKAGHVVEQPHDELVDRRAAHAYEPDHPARLDLAQLSAKVRLERLCGKPLYSGGASDLEQTKQRPRTSPPRISKRTMLQGGDPAPVLRANKPRSRVGAGELMKEDVVGNPATAQRGVGQVVAEELHRRIRIHGGHTHPELTQVAPRSTHEVPQGSAANIAPKAVCGVLDVQPGRDCAVDLPIPLGLCLLEDPLDSSPRPPPQGQALHSHHQLVTSPGPSVFPQRHEHTMQPQSVRKLDLSILSLDRPPVGEPLLPPNLRVLPQKGLGEVLPLHALVRDGIISDRHARFSLVNQSEHQLGKVGVAGLPGTGHIVQRDRLVHAASVRR